MSLTKAQIEKYFKLVFGTATCPFCHHQDFELVLDKDGEVAIFETIEQKGAVVLSGESTKTSEKEPCVKHQYIAARCVICNWIAYFDYECIKKALEPKAN